MTFAWYAHLKNLAGRPWYIAALVSWGIALFEYLLQVPANRIGYTQLSLPQLKILQEVHHAQGVRAVRDVLHGQAASSWITCGRRCASWVRCISSSGRRDPMKNENTTLSRRPPSTAR